MALTYRAIYRAQFCDKNHITTVVTFEKLMDDSLPMPLVKDILLAGIESVPVQLSYKADGEYKMQQINGTECSFKFIAQDGFQLKSLYARNETEFRVTMTGGKKWQGFIIPDSCSEPFLYENYEVMVRATDRLGILKDLAYMNGGMLYRGFDNDITTVQRILAMTGLRLELVVAVNTFEAAMNVNISPLAQAYPDNAGYSDGEGNAFSCEDVLRSILTRWSSQLHQFEGRWQILNSLEKTRGNVPARVFSSTGVVYPDPITVVTEVVAGGDNRSLRPVGTSWLSPALAQSTAYYKYGYPSNKLVNGDFNDWPLPLVIPPGWELKINSGVVNVTRRFVADDPADIYPEISGAGNGYMQNITPIQVRANESVDISMDMFAPTAFQVNAAPRYLSILVYNDRGFFFTANGWQQQGANYVIRYESGSLRNQQSIRFKVDPTDSDYGLYIGLIAIGVISGAHFATNYNNVNVKPAVASNQAKPSVGAFTRHQLLSEQSKKRDPLLILHGDELNDRRTSRVFINNIPPVAVFSWKRANYVESVPLLTILASTELTMHQRPYNIFEAQFFGAGDIDINNILSVDDLEGKYTFLYGDFDLMGGKHKLTLSEITNQKLIEGVDVTGVGIFMEDYGIVDGKAVSGLGSVGNVNPGGGSGGGGTGGSTIDPNAFIRNQTEYQTSAQFNILRGVFSLEVTSPNFIGNLTGNASSATLWGGGQADFSSFGTSLYSILGYDAITSKVKNFTKEQVISELGINLQGVTNAGNVTNNLMFITGANKIPTSGAGLATYYSDDVSRVLSINWTSGTLKPIYFAGSLFNFSNGDVKLDRKLLIGSGTRGGIADSASIYYDSESFGVVIQGKSGGASDLTFSNNNGSTVFYVSPNTSNVNFEGIVVAKTQVVSSQEGFKSISHVGLVGNYNEAGLDSKIIWTIGSSLTDLNNMYGVGYDYAVKPGFTHSIFFANGGLKSAWIDLATGSFSTKGTVSSYNFQSGALGSGWSVDQAGNMEVDNLTVRKTFTVTTLNIREITGTGGSFAVTNTFLTKSVQEIIFEGRPFWAFEFDNEGGVLGIQLRQNDVVRCQVWDGTGVKFYTGVVYQIYPNGFVMDKLSVTGSGIPAAGDKLFQFGNTTDTDRQGVIYLTNSDTGAPYIDIMDGVTSDSWVNKTKVRLGKLNALTVPIWGALTGYGLYADNVYLTNGNFSGTVNVTGGNAETVTGAQNKVNALEALMGDLAFLDTVEAARLGTTVIQGGYILTSLLKANEIQALVVTAAYINALTIDAVAIKTGTIDSARINASQIVVNGGGVLSSDLGDLAFLDLVETAKLGTTVIQGGYILTSLLKANEIQALTVTAAYINALTIDASAIKTGQLSADRIDVDNLIAKNLKTFTSGRRLEITGALNALRFYGIDQSTTNPYLALTIADDIDSQSSGQSLGGIRTTSPSGAVSYMSGNGVFSNGGGTQFIEGSSGILTNGTIVGLLFDRNTDSNGFSAAIFGRDATTSGNSTSYAGFFIGGVRINGGLQVTGTIQVDGMTGATGDRPVRINANGVLYRGT